MERNRVKGRFKDRVWSQKQRRTFVTEVPVHRGPEGLLGCRWGHHRQEQPEKGKEAGNTGFREQMTEQLAVILGAR